MQFDESLAVFSRVVLFCPPASPDYTLLTLTSIRSSSLAALPGVVSEAVCAVDQALG
jgi:hypothetical protein